jgi:hypothetical protein
VIVTGHQVNFIPGCSVMEKVRAADVCIWMDAMQYERHGFVNRNRFSDADESSWITVPVFEEDTFAPINRVRIADQLGYQRKKIARTLEHRIGAKNAAPYVAELLKPYKLLIGLNWQLLRRLCDDLEIKTAHHFQSHLDSGHAVPVVSEHESELVPARERLAMMVEEIGGTVWLSGPSGRKYLDEAPFYERGIQVEYFDFEGPNPSAITRLKR